MADVIATGAVPGPNQDAAIGNAAGLGLGEMAGNIFVQHRAIKRIEPYRQKLLASINPKSPMSEQQQLVYQAAQDPKEFARLSGYSVRGAIQQAAVFPNQKTRTITVTGGSQAAKTLGLASLPKGQMFKVQATYDSNDQLIPNTGSVVSQITNPYEAKPSANYAWNNPTNPAQGEHPIKGGPADISQFLNDPGAIDIMASQVLQGHPPAMGRSSNATGLAARVKVYQRAGELAAMMAGQPNATPQQKAMMLMMRQTAVRATQDSLNALKEQNAKMSAAERTANLALDTVLHYAKAAYQQHLRTGSPWLNAPLMTIAKGLFGAKDIGALQNALQTATNEYAKVASGSYGASGSTDAAQKNANAMLSGAMPFDVLVQNIGQLRRDMNNRTTGNANEEAALVQSVTGATPGIAAPPPTPPSTPTPTPAATPGGIMHVTNAQDYAHVPSGAQYYDPHGTLRTKP